jgi:hypothetical protein
MKKLSLLAVLYAAVGASQASGQGAAAPVGGTPAPETSSVPEGGAALQYLLLAGASCFGAVVYASRKRPGNSESA